MHGRKYRCGKSPDDVILEESGRCRKLFSTHNVWRSNMQGTCWMRWKNRMSPSRFAWGVLNQNTEEGTVPVEVSSDLERLGIG